MSSNAPVTVVVADDDTNVRSALCHLFEDAADITVVAEAGTAEEAVEAVEAHRPDVAVVDVRMPGDGLDAVQRITGSGGPTRVVVLTAQDEPDARVRAAANGATRFIAKSGGDDLVSAVRDVAAGRPDATQAQSAARS